MTEWLTTRAVRNLIHGSQDHQIRRAIDALVSDGKLTIIHAAQYRLVRAEDVETIRGWLIEKGWIRGEAMAV